MRNFFHPMSLKRSGWQLCAFIGLIALLGGGTVRAAAPVIDSVKAGAGIPAVTNVKIYGHNFSSTLANNFVYFGATLATIISGDTDSLLVTVPNGALYMRVSVTDTSTHLTGYSKIPFNPIFDNTCFLQDTIRYQPKVDFRTSLDPPYHIAIGDIDGDGKPDVVSASRPPTTRSVYRIDIFRNVSSSGVITTSSLSLAYSINSSAFRPTNIKLADLDGDGRLDIIVTPNNSSRLSVYRNISTPGTVSITSGTTFLGVQGTSTPYSAYGITMLLGEVSVADFDRDGKPDLAVTATQRDSVNVLRNTMSTPLGASAAFPTSSFANFQRFSIGSSALGAISLITTDLDGDGKPEIATSNLLSGSISILRDTSTIPGSIGFATPVEVSAATNVAPFQIASGDMDGDNRPDIVIAGHQLAVSPSTHGVCVFKNASSSGIINFSSRVDYTSGLSQPRTLALADMNGDGTIDIAVCNYAANTVSIFKNTASGSFSSSSLVQYPGRAVGQQPVGIAIGDLNGDAKPEIIVANSDEAETDSTFSILENRQQASVDSIYGNTDICISSTTDTLKDSTIGGRWMTSNPYVASIDPVSGRVIPVSIGTFTATYEYVCGGDTGRASKTIRIISTPSVTPISGPSTLCTGLTFTLTNSTAGGVWGSLSPSVATIDGSGNATGLAVGSATITYGVTNTCGTRIVTFPVTVAATPAPITGSTFEVCSGSTIRLSSSTSGGSWLTTAGTGTASAASTGDITGGFDGTVLITYRMSSGCYDTAMVTVNPLPASISGSSSVCLGDIDALSTTSFSGVWTSSSPGIATVDAGTGDVYTRSTGTVTISYTFASTGCYVTFPVTINANPAPIARAGAYCEGNSFVLTDATSGGSWTSSSTGIASVVTSASGAATIYGVSSGTSIITYTVASTGCSDTALVTINPIPMPITGPTNVCLGDTMVLSDASSSGTWSSSVPARASVSTTGSVYGRSSGTATISYTFASTGCFVTRNITVDTLPAPITGLSTICPGYTITASTAAAAGIWTHTSPMVDTLGATTGLITGIAAGTDTITYTITATGCKTSAVISVNPAPLPISGPTSVCQASFVMLTDSSAGGAWSSSDVSIASVDATTGIVTGVSAGFATISYTTPDYGCSAFLSMRVNPILVPSVIVNTSTGTTVCAGTSVTYTAIPINGGTPTYKWFVNRVLVSTGGTLVYTPVNGDTVSVRMFSTATCAVPDSIDGFVRMTVNPTIFPSVDITTGVGDTVCIGTSVTFTPIPTNGGTPTYTWKVNGVMVWTGPSWTFTPTNGDRITVIMNSTIACRYRDTVSHTKIMTVSPPLTPSVSISGSDTVCGSNPAIFNAVGTNSGFTPSFVWQVNGFDYSTGPTLAYPATTGDYIGVRMTSSFPCLATPTASTSRGPLTVLPVVIPTVWLGAYPGFIVLPGTTVTIIAYATDTGAHPIYRWFKNGLPIAGATRSVYRASGIASGDHFVCKVTNTDPCNGLTGFNTVSITLGDNVGVGNVGGEEVAITIAPNPNNGQFTLLGDFGTSFDEEMMLEVTNTVGQTVYRRQVRANTGRLNEEVLLNGNSSAGMYFLSLRSAHMNRTIRFVVH